MIKHRTNHTTLPSAVAADMGNLASTSPWAHMTCNGNTSRAGVFNLLSSRANLHLSYNPVGRSHCELQNHHGYIYRGMGGSQGDIGEVTMT